MNTKEKLHHFVEHSRDLLDHLSGLVFIKDIESHIVECTQGFSDHVKISKKDLIGKSDDDLPWANYASLYRQHDEHALIGKTVDAFEPVPIDSHTILALRTVKRSIRDNTGEIIGVLAQSELLPIQHHVGKLVSTLSVKDKKIATGSLGERRNYKYANYNETLKLTQRETECLFLLIRAKSAKEIAQFLEISPRTVETYIEQIKDKMGVSTRAEMMTKAIEMGMLEIIPKNDMLINLYKNFHKWEDFFV